jgi:hypothetical protein
MENGTFIGDNAEKNLLATPLDLITEKEMLIFKIPNLTLFLAYDMVSNGNYRQIFFIIFGPDKISCLFNRI